MVMSCVLRVTLVGRRSHLTDAKVHLTDMWDLPDTGSVAGKSWGNTQTLSPWPTIPVLATSVRGRRGQFHFWQVATMDCHREQSQEPFPTTEGRQCEKKAREEDMRTVSIIWKTHSRCRLTKTNRQDLKTEHCSGWSIGGQWVTQDTTGSQCMTWKYICGPRSDRKDFEVFDGFLLYSELFRNCVLYV